MASIEFITERIEKANTAISKKQNTIAKKTALIAKKEAKVAKLTDENDIFWTNADIKHLNEDIVRLGKEIEEKKNTLAKYEAQLAGANAIEDLYETKVPEVMKTLEAEFIEAWDAFDKVRKQNLLDDYHELGWKEFHNKYRNESTDVMWASEDEIHQANVKASRSLVLDLYQRVHAITGEVTDWSNIHCTQGTHGFAVLNGQVYGKEGRANVESILAGGYNIQRLHVRVLVHAF